MESYASDLQVLEVGEKYCRYYSGYAELEDSLYTYTRKFGLGKDNEGRRKQSTYEEIFYDYPEAGVISVYTRYLDNTYVYTDLQPQPQWELLSDTCTVLGYTCQKARSYFLGRTWYAWFSPEIPMNRGPWKLCGLPGLILKAEDEDKYFTFEAVEVSQTRGDKMMMYNENASKCKRKDILVLNDLRWQDDSLLMQIVGGKEMLQIDPVTMENTSHADRPTVVIPQKELE